MESSDKIALWEIWINEAKKCKDSLNFFLYKRAIQKEKEKEFLTKSHIKKADYNLDFINFLKENKKFYDWIIVGCYYVRN